LGKILTITIRPPRKSFQLKYVIWRKNSVDHCKNVVSETGKKFYKK